VYQLSRCGKKRRKPKRVEIANKDEIAANGEKSLPDTTLPSTTVLAGGSACNLGALRTHM